MRGGADSISSREFGFDSGMCVLQFHIYVQVDSHWLVVEGGKVGG